MTSTNTNNKVIKDMMPGLIGGIFNTYIGQPFDTVRVKMQDVSLTIVIV